MSKAENQRLLSERQLDSLSYPEPPSDFADRVMDALLTPKIEPKPRPRTLLWLGVSAATFALGVASSPLLRAPTQPSVQLQAVTQPTQTIPTPAGGPSMIPVKTALGALSILGAFLGNMGPAVEPGDKQTKKFCKDVVASCQENPAEVCEEIWRFCEEAPVGSAKKKTVTVEVTKTFNWSEGELEQQQDELEAMQDEVEALAEELQECYAEGCSPSEIKRLKSQLDQEVAALKKQAKALKSQIRPEPPELPEVPEPPAPPVAPKKSTWVTPFAPMAPLAPMAPNWGGTVIVIPGGEVRFEAPEADSFRFEFGEEGFDGECAECQREKLREEVRQKYQDKIEAQIDEILERQDEALQKKLKKKAKKERKESKDHPDE